MIVTLHPASNFLNSCMDGNYSQLCMHSSQLTSIDIMCVSCVSLQKIQVMQLVAMQLAIYIYGYVSAHKYISYGQPYLCTDTHTSIVSQLLLYQLCLYYMRIVNIQLGCLATVCCMLYRDVERSVFVQINMFLYSYNIFFLVS